jgi:hypothetical protein
LNHIESRLIDVTAKPTLFLNRFPPGEAGGCFEEPAWMAFA